MVQLSSRRRWLVPEVVQTSAMDCGPAVLKCLLEGFGIRVHYGRLREACQTDVDGTSIDTLEETAQQLGLEAHQVMLPLDHLLLAESNALPAIVVVELPGGDTHFVLVWRSHGPWVQVMDPAHGRRWMTASQLLREVYVHKHRVPASAWEEWARSDEFRGPLAERLRALGLGRRGVEFLRARMAGSGWRHLAALDAATRLVATLVKAGALRRGREAYALLNELVQRIDREEIGQQMPRIPDHFWSVQPAPSGSDGEEYLFIRGAVLVQVGGRREEPPIAEQLGPELTAAMDEPTSRVGQILAPLLRDVGWPVLVMLSAALLLAVAGVLMESLLLYAALDVGHELNLVQQRLGAMAALLTFGLLLLCVELYISQSLFRLGRQLEIRLRAAFQGKLPHLHDRYFQSRPMSDMVERSHMLHHVRLLPCLAGKFLRTVLTLGATAAMISWLSPTSSLIAFGAASLGIMIPLAFLPLLNGLDLRVRTHAGVLTRFYLDALLGLTALRAHAAERVVRREHEGLLVDWSRASQRLLCWTVAVEAVQILIGFGLAGWLLAQHVGHTADSGAVLLLAYWALNLPMLGEEVILMVRQYPLYRNTALRLLEPLGAPEADSSSPIDLNHTSRALPPSGQIVARTTPHITRRRGVSLDFQSVNVSVAGRSILHDVTVRIEAGTHVAIVGASGAGKSSFVGLLLGWYRVAAGGRILIDDEALDTDRLNCLRRETVWVDPAVQLWNRSLFENLRYGANGDPLELDHVLRASELRRVVQRLPDGLQSSLGEGGGRLSGGEGQRVRIGRGLARANARLAILDEPFRGLDRPSRRQLLETVRQDWNQATLLCITHDVSETRGFERVLVMHDGRIVEDGPPSVLAENTGSRYRGLLDAEEAVRQKLWSSPRWRRMWLENGLLTNGCGEART